MKKNKKLKSTTGFTIIETMISVSIFLIIIMVGMGALLNAHRLHQKSNNMRSILDNLSFIMEDMSRSLRTGYNYHCIDSTNDDDLFGDVSVYSCENGGGGISFDSTSDPVSRWIYFIGDCGDNTNGICKSVDGSDLIQLVPSEVTISSASSFTVIGAEPPPNEQQPFVTIRLVGEINIKNVVTPFSLQTSVSQRNIDI
ncbi:MAG: hypothetical protein WC735_02485 [Candidatus Paceibacterota bacterium]|jgi:type II secretory pathway pseudopilin PulG